MNHGSIRVLIIISNISMSAEHAKPIDELLLSDLETVGFTSQVDEYLALNEVSREQVVAEMERSQGITLVVAVGNVKLSKEMQAEGKVQAGSPEHEALANEQAAASVPAEASAPEAPAASEEVAPEASSEAAPEVTPEAPAPQV